MHIDLPKDASKSFREFLSHYALIVLSILTALALEQLLTNFHHHAAARASNARIDQEIATNRDEIDKILKRNHKHIIEQKAALEICIAESKDKNTKESDIINSVSDLNTKLDLYLPTLRHDAFDAAIADQSVQFLKPEHLRHYSEIYSTQRDFIENEHLVIDSSLFGEASNLALSVKMGHVDPRDAASLLTRFIVANQILEGNMLELKKIMQ